MKYELILNKVINILKRHYWTHVIVLSVLFIAVFFKLIGFADEPLPSNVVLERYAIVITIIVIPSALKMFAVLLGKLKDNDGFEERVKRYKRASYIRLYSISAVTLMNIVLFAVYRNSNYMWLAILLFVVYIFCQPSYEELNGLITIGETNHKQEVETMDSSAKNSEDERNA